MKKTREQKGITLVALIITIVVLLVLATVAISSIKNDGIISKAQDVANKFNEAQSNEQGILDEYLSYLQGEQWETIYESDTPLIEGGAQVLSTSEHLFKAGAMYRITVEGISEPIVTKAVFFQRNEYASVYMLFLIMNNGTAMTCDSIEDYNEVVESLPEGALADACMAINGVSSEGKISAIAMEAGGECIITKVEQKVEEGEEEDSGLIFEGELALTAGTQTTISVTSPIVPTRKYQVEATINGESTTIDADTVITSTVALKDGSLQLIMDGNRIVSYIEGCVIKSIYDVGPSDTYVEENGFGAYNGGDGWCLVKTPSTSYTVPTTISGKTISKVQMDYISGEPTFANSVNLLVGDVIQNVTGITVTTIDADFFLEKIEAVIGYSISDLDYIDLSACGDNIEFTEEFFTRFQTKIDSYGEDWAVVYVSSAVKANYADYDFIVAK